MAAVTVASTSRAWYEGSTAIYWTARCAFDTGTALYVVTQDSGATPKIRVRKADSRTAPTAFTEQDSANNKDVSNGNYSWTSWLAGGFIHIIGFSAVTTSVHYLFNTATDAWDTGFGTNLAGASNEQPHRFGVRSDGDVVAAWSSVGDDADVGRSVWEGASWSNSATGFHGGVSDNASTIADAVMDASDYFSLIFLDAVTSSLVYRTRDSGNTNGTTTTIDASVGTDDTTHSAGGVFTPYDDGGTDKVIVAYIDADGTLKESVLTLESAANASNVAANVAIESTASNVGARTPLTTCRFDGTDYCMWWDDASSGTIFYSTKTAGTWAAATAWKTSVSRPVQLLPVGTDGLLAVYHSAATTVAVDWVVAPEEPEPPEEPAPPTPDDNEQEIRNRRLISVIAGGSGVM